MKKISCLLLYLLFLSWSAAAFSHGEFVVTDSIPQNGIRLSGVWKFRNGDDARWADPKFDDSSWDTTRTSLQGKEFSGLGWFRLRIRIDSTRGVPPVVLAMKHRGASEIYVNGTLLQRYGLPGPREMEERFDPKGLPLHINYTPGIPLLLAVKYSNHEPEHSFDAFGENLVGFRIILFSSTHYTRSLIKSSIVLATFSNFIFGFLIALGLSHLFIYLFYRKYRSNIYYFIFVVLLAHFIIFGHMLTNTNSVDLESYYVLASLILFPFFFVSLLALVYSFYHDKFPVFLKIMFGIALLNSILLFTQSEFGAYVLFFITVACSIETLRVIIVSMIKKKKGAKIIGAGILIFAFFVILVAMSAATTGGFVISKGGWMGVVLLALCLLSIVSIPLFMSVFLAWNFAQTSTELSIKLEEVETLSARSIEQEKEKQKILENQKEELEYLVKERTQEVVTQKHIIEEKNKDITDSINYAKRIQDAFLPAKELKYRLFPDAFVLFQPRDIVSGDFYWFTEKNGKRMIAAADCTGHGVPGAFMSMIGNAFLNEVVNERGMTDAGEILSELRHRVIQSLRQTGSEGQSKDGMDIALLAFNDENSSMQYSGANNPLWRIRMENDQPVFEEFEPNKRPIGYHLGKDLPFTSHNLPVKKGDTFYIFTDGFADQFGGPKGKKFKYRQLQELLMSIQHQSMPDQEKILLEAFNKWKGEMAQIDDVLLIGIRA